MSWSYYRFYPEEIKDYVTSPRLRGIFLGGDVMYILADTKQKIKEIDGKYKYIDVYILIDPETGQIKEVEHEWSL